MQSTRNNSIIEPIMIEDLTASELSNDSANLEEASLKYTCLDYNFVTLRKDFMDKHVKETHQPNENEEVKFSCIKCGHDFNELENYNTHVKSHDELSVKPEQQDTIEKKEKENACLQNLVYNPILENLIETYAQERALNIITDDELNEHAKR